MLAGCGEKATTEESRTSKAETEKELLTAESFTENVKDPEIEAENVFLSSTLLNDGDSTFTADVTSEDALKFSIAATDFSLDLFRKTASGAGNEMISPVSVMYALAMASNGAKGKTLSQIEYVMGMTKDAMNQYLGAYMNSLPCGETYSLSVANSFWMRDRYSVGVVPSYLTDLRSYYNADVLSAPFDENTVKDMNDWISEKTNGMIDNAVNDVSYFEAMLINALTFEAEWEQIFFIENVKEKTFTTADNNIVTAEVMVQKMYPSNKNYFENENSKGFIKYYSDQKYAFVAMLPDEGITLDKFIDTLDGETVNSLITNAEECHVNISLPKFESRYKKSLKSELSSLGIKDAFNITADFSGINPTSPVFLSDVVHKTYIKVHEKGTEAAAVSLATMNGSSRPPEEIKEVHLNRPFVYMIIDCENSVPLFLGTVTDPTK